MKKILAVSCGIFILFSLQNCSPKMGDFSPKKVYKTEHIIITQISENVYIHTSYLQTQDFGNVPCNGMLVLKNNEAIVFDTPTDDNDSEELIQWIQNTQNAQIKAIVPTHFHLDCLGGLQAFHKHQIPSYANKKTIEFAQENHYVLPQNAFEDSLVLKVGTEDIITKFFGEGHTKDNVVGYFPEQQILFGGCLLKELQASKGYLGDANVNDWSATVQKIKNNYPNIKLVVPGHGKYGNADLLDYTIQLFNTN